MRAPIELLPPQCKRVGTPRASDYLGDPLQFRHKSLALRYLKRHKGTVQDPMANLLLEKAAHQRPATTKRGALERLFTLMFQGFVYNQIWEDPDVDLEALELNPNHRLLTIASGGCNVLNYLAANPAKIIAVDLNPNHIALTRLKLSALENLPSYDEFFRFFGQANDKANREAYDNFLSERLDATTRRYWEKHVPLKGRRINMF